MDGGSLRGPKPADSRSTGRQEPVARRQPESAPVQPTASQPELTARRAEPARERRKLKRRAPSKHVLVIATIAIVIVALVSGWLLWGKGQGAAAGIDGSKYQAVFFTNGQVYFGKLHAFNSESMKLTDIYYLQGKQTAANADKSTNPQDSNSDSSNVQLIKLGSEVHGPEDQMVILKNQMLFYENLKPNGKVTESIAKHQDSNK